MRCAPRFLVSLLCLSAIFMVIGTAHGQTQRLRVGDTAPGLDIEEWVSSSPVEIAEGRVFIITFWATWCAPCKRAMPMLSSMQEQYRDRISIIGVSTEQIGVVRSFFNQNRTLMRYAVGVDRQSATSRAWMEAAGQSGIPASFIVDRRGRVQFIGNPLASDFEDIVSRVVAGRYDARLFRQGRPAIDAARRARQLKNYRLAIHHYEQLLETDKTVFASFALEKFEMLLLDIGDRTAAYAYATTLLEDYASDPDLLIDLSAKIAADDKLSEEQRDFEIAELAANAAVAQLDANDPRRFSAPARVHFFRGNVDEAVRLQRQAWRTARPEEKARYRGDLDMYQSGAARQSGTDGASSSR